MTRAPGFGHVVGTRPQEIGIISRFDGDKPFLVQVSFLKFYCGNCFCCRRAEFIHSHWIQKVYFIHSYCPLYLCKQFYIRIYIFLIS